MIIGIGTDIIDTRRIKKTFSKFGDKFKKRCFSSCEIKKSDNKLNSVNSYAKKYTTTNATNSPANIAPVSWPYWPRMPHPIPPAKAAKHIGIRGVLIAGTIIG